MAVAEFFHLIHIVDDEDQVDEFYDRLFAPYRFRPKHWSDGEKRWASLSMVSDLMVEVIEPSSDPADASMALSKFHHRHGQHLHSLSWYVEPTTMVPLFAGLRAHGVRVAKPGGGFFADDVSDPGSTIFTHPKDTFGQLEFQDRRGLWEDTEPRLRPGWTVAPWLDGPLGIERLSHMTTVVRDLGAARRFYEQVLGAVVLEERRSSAAQQVFVLVGPDTVIEIAQPMAEGTPLATDLATHGELPHSATFRVRDLAAVERHVQGIGVRVGDRGEDSITLHPDDCYGAVWSFTERDVPGDPRVGGPS